jgi:hypothetical protein
VAPPFPECSKRRLIQRNDAPLAACRLCFANPELLFQKVNLGPPGAAQFSIPQTRIAENNYRRVRAGLRTLAASIEDAELLERSLASNHERAASSQE